jgi:hypothetical protein
VAVALFFEGTTVLWVPVELLLLELLELEELLELDETVHGGTISVVTRLLVGSTSWFCGVGPPLCWAPPPGVMRTVLAGGGPADELLLLLLLLLDPPCGMHGWTATVSVTERVGIRIWFEPGGAFPPDGVTCASEQGGTTMVSGVCCLGITTVRTPGF